MRYCISLVSKNVRRRRRSQIPPDVSWTTDACILIPIEGSCEKRDRGGWTKRATFTGLADFWRFAIPRDHDRDIPHRNDVIGVTHEWRRDEGRDRAREKLSLPAADISRKTVWLAWLVLRPTACIILCVTLDSDFRVFVTRLRYAESCNTCE